MQCLVLERLDRRQAADIAVGLSRNGKRGAAEVVVPLTRAAARGSRVGAGVAVIPVEPVTVGPSAATDPLGLPVSVKVSVAVPLPATVLSPLPMTALPEPSLSVSE